MKNFALPIITLALAASAAQADFGMQSMMNPMSMMAPMSMMSAPMGMMNTQQWTNPYLNPMAAGNPYSMAPTGGAGSFPMMPFSMMPQQQSAPGYGASAQGAFTMPFFQAPAQSAMPQASMSAPIYGAPAQGAFIMPLNPAATVPVGVPQAAAPAGFDASAWMRMFPNSTPPTSAAVPAVATPPAPTAAAPAAAPVPTEPTAAPVATPAPASPQ